MIAFETLLHFLLTLLAVAWLMQQVFLLSLIGLLTCLRYSLPSKLPSRS
jgi:hypothetical protein